jgi:hypothetical protein
MRHRGRAALQRRESGLEPTRALAPVTAFAAAKEFFIILLSRCLRRHLVPQLAISCFRREIV